MMIGGQRKESGRRRVGRENTIAGRRTREKREAGRSKEEQRQGTDRRREEEQKGALRSSWVQLVGGAKRIIKRGWKEKGGIMGCLINVCARAFFNYFEYFT